MNACMVIKALMLTCVLYICTFFSFSNLGDTKSIFSFTHIETQHTICNLSVDANLIGFYLLTKTIDSMAYEINCSRLLGHVHQCLSRGYTEPLRRINPSLRISGTRTRRGALDSKTNQIFASGQSQMRRKSTQKHTLTPPVHRT